MALSFDSPSHQMKFPGELGLSLQYLSSRNSWPMKSMGMPGAVSRRPVATRERLRAYQDRALVGSAKAGMRGFLSLASCDSRSKSWFSMNWTVCQAAEKPGGG